MTGDPLSPDPAPLPDEPLVPDVPDVPPLADAALGTDVLAHLDSQLASARRLHSAVLGQGTSIVSRDVDGVLARANEIQREMAHRTELEEERRVLLIRASEALGVPVDGVTLDALADRLAPDEAEGARARSAELRELLTEIAREHGLSRLLLRQELGFLDHVVRLVTGEPQGAYGPGAPVASVPSPAQRALNLQA